MHINILFEIWPSLVDHGCNNLCIHCLQQYQCSGEFGEVPRSLFCWSMVCFLTDLLSQRQKFVCEDRISSSPVLFQRPEFYWRQNSRVVLEVIAHGRVETCVQPSTKEQMWAAVV